MQAEFVQTLTETLRMPLPGPVAQYRMAHLSRLRQLPPPSPDVRQAAVLVLFYSRNDQWQIVLIRRVEKLTDKHSGQVSFPGGKRDNGESIAMTALRECQEEIACPMEEVDLIGSLTSLHIPVSNFVVYPFTGVLKREVQFVPQETEVSEIIEVPLSELLDPATRQTTSMILPSGLHLSDVPCFKIREHVVWGATAMILNELIELMTRNEDLMQLLSEPCTASNA